MLPMLEGDRFVGRLDPKFHRDTETLEVRRLYWEPAFAPTRARQRGLDEALAILAERIGARQIDITANRGK